eukprot:ctg_2636.g584
MSERDRLRYVDGMDITEGFAKPHYDSGADSRGSSPSTGVEVVSRGPGGPVAPEGRLPRAQLSLHLVRVFVRGGDTRRGGAGAGGAADVPRLPTVGAGGQRQSAVVAVRFLHRLPDLPLAHRARSGAQRPAVRGVCAAAAAGPDPHRVVALGAHADAVQPRGQRGHLHRFRLGAGVSAVQLRVSTVESTAARTAGVFRAGDRGVRGHRGGATGAGQHEGSVVLLDGAGSDHGGVERGADADRAARLYDIRRRHPLHHPVEHGAESGGDRGEDRGYDRHPVHLPAAAGADCAGAGALDR